MEDEVGYHRSSDDSTNCEDIGYRIYILMTFRFPRCRREGAHKTLACY
jgi:hypothetical protein